MPSRLRNATVTKRLRCRARFTRGEKRVDRINRGAVHAHLDSVGKESTEGSTQLTSNSLLDRRKLLSVEAIAVLPSNDRP